MPSTLATVFMLGGFGALFYMMHRKGGGCCGGHSDHHSAPPEQVEEKPEIEEKLPENPASTQSEKIGDR